MQRIDIYYFSGTGNTWWVANELKQQLTKVYSSVGCYSIEALTPEKVKGQLEKAGHIVLGFPVYGSTAPKLVLEFIQQLPLAGNEKKISVFATQALASGDTAYHIGQKLVLKGYDLRQAMHFRMMNNFHLPRFRFYRPRNDYRLEKLLKKALPRVEKLAKLIISDEEYITGNNLLGHFLGSFQRKHIDKIEKLSRDFEVDTSSCIDCGKCKRICPVQNIEKCEGAYQFGDKCILCLRCYSQCPQSAILIGKGSKDQVKYPRYRGPGRSFDINVLTHLSND